MEENKKNLWPWFFIGIFGFTFSMVLWTLYSTTKAHVIQDQSFNSSYHKIDRGYNKIYNSTKKLKSLHKITISINNSKIPFKLKDAFISARELDRDINNNKRKMRLVVGTNTISFKINDYKKIKDIKFDIIVMNNVNKKDNVHLTKFNLKNGIYSANFNIPRKGKWNLTGYIQINNIKGYFFYRDVVK